jgi:hypothetical protein
MLPPDSRKEVEVRDIPERSSQLGQQVENPQEYLREKSIEMSVDSEVPPVGMDLKTELESQFSPSEFNSPRVADKSFTLWENEFDEPDLGPRDPVPLLNKVEIEPIKDGPENDAGPIQHHQMETSINVIRDSPLVTILRTLRVYRNRRSFRKDDSFLLGGLQFRLEPMVYGFYHIPDNPNAPPLGGLTMRNIGVRTSVRTRRDVPYGVF